MLAISGRIPARDEIELPVIAKALRSPAFKAAPYNRKIPAEACEKLRTRQMNVRVGDCHRVLFNHDHDHMRVGFSDIVLDREPCARSRRRRRQPRMTEFQLTGRLDPPHERLDCWPVLRQQAVDMRASEHLFRVGGGKLIQGLVQIHDEAMQAVAVFVGKPRKSCDLCEPDRIRRSRPTGCFDR